MNEVKYIKKDYYNAIIELANGNDVEMPVEEIIQFCEKEIAALERRAEKAKENAAKKKAEGDAVMDAIEAVLSTEDFEPVADIIAKVDIPELTASKVYYRLRCLKDAGKVEKEQIEITLDEEGKKKRKVMGYRKVQ